jgi:predicted ATPase
LFVPILKCLLAEILLSHRRLEEAGAAIRDAESVIAMSERHYFAAEVWRLKAEHHFHSGSYDLAQADLHTAMALARRQNAKALELRAAISYARFSTAQGVFGRACDVLTEAANGVEAEAGNPDLMSARTLLEMLPRR